MKGPRNSLGAPFTGETWTCLRCGATGPDRDGDRTSLARCPRDTDFGGRGPCELSFSPPAHELAVRMRDTPAGRRAPAAPPSALTRAHLLTARFARELVGALGLCAFCGAPLDAAGNRTCDCKPPSNLERTVAVAIALTAGSPHLSTRLALREAVSIRPERSH